MKNSALNVQWQAWSEAYLARTQREKIILLLAALAVVYTLVDQVWLSPALKQMQTKARAVAEKQAQLNQLNGQIAQLAEQGRQRDAQLVAALAAARQDVSAVSAQLAEFERTLVPARHMAGFLRGLMPGAAIEISALKTLPPTPLVQRQPKEDAAPADGAPKAAAGTQPAGASHNLYKHGVEITLSGSYPALLDYLNRLENAPQKVLWGTLDLQVEQHPNNQLKLVLYTLSLDPAWLAV